MKYIFTTIILYKSLNFTIMTAPNKNNNSTNGAKRSDKKSGVKETFSKSSSKYPSIYFDFYK